MVDGRLLLMELRGGATVAADLASLVIALLVVVTALAIAAR